MFDLSELNTQLMRISTYHDILISEFEQRKNANNSYSLRAFARDINIGVPRLSKVMRKLEGISYEKAILVSESLNLNEDQKNIFTLSAGSLHARSYKQRAEYLDELEKCQEKIKKFNDIELDFFQVISDWYHFAILELTYLKDFQNNIEWMASRLSIDSIKVKEAIIRLKKLNLLVEEDGALVDQFKFLATPSDIPSPSIKKFHTQLIQKGLKAANNKNLEDREVACNIFSISKKRMPEFKEKLKKFRRELEEFANDNSDKDAVYCLNSQFFELTQKENI